MSVGRSRTRLLNTSIAASSVRSSPLTEATVARGAMFAGRRPSRRATSPHARVGVTSARPHARCQCTDVLTGPEVSVGGDWLGGSRSGSGGGLLTFDRWRGGLMATTKRRQAGEGGISEYQTKAGPRFLIKYPVLQED